MKRAIFTFAFACLLLVATMATASASTTYEDKIRNRNHIVSLLNNTRLNHTRFNITNTRDDDEEIIMAKGAAAGATMAVEMFNALGQKDFAKNFIDNIKTMVTAIKSLDKKNRGAFTQRVTDDAFALAQRKWNILVVNAESHYRHDLEGLMTIIKLSYGAFDYRLYVFKKGSFTLNSDGGYINWSYKGNCKRPNPKRLECKQM